MAEQIVTLGIGGTPANLTSFITTGLEIGEVSLFTAGSIGNTAFIRQIERRAIVKRVERRVFIKED